MRKQLKRNWPDATVVINSVIENIVGDFGIQFYLHRDGSVVWLGLTEQHFNQAKRWCGGTYSNHLQTVESLILSAFEDSGDDETTTICHISVLSDSQERNQNVLGNLEMARDCRTLRFGSPSFRCWELRVSI